MPLCRTVHPAKGYWFGKISWISICKNDFTNLQNYNILFRVVGICDEMIRMKNLAGQLLNKCSDLINKGSAFTDVSVQERGIE